MIYFRYFFLLLFLVISSFGLSAQVLYGLIDDNGSGSDSVVVIDVNECSVCTAAPTCSSTAYEVEVMPNGNFLVSNGGLLICNPSGGQIQDLGAASYQSVGVGGGIYYYSGFFVGLGQYNANTGTTQTIGDLPANFLLSSSGDFFFINGILYALGINLTTGASEIYQINTTNPSASTFVAAPPLLNPQGVATVGNTVYIMDWNATGSVLYTYDIATNSLTEICSFPGKFIFSLGALPSGVAPLNCCTTNAGTLPQGGPYNICINGTLTFPPATGTVLDANDLLRYILFSNPADTAGSIVAISSTPTFTFNPATMQTGVTYYIAAMAGNGLNGNVDLNDPCLDFSNALQVIWRPLPSVTFSVANPDVCAGGCTNVTATFTGTAPFTLTYVIPGNGPQTQTFTGNTGTFQVCVPAGAPAGSFQINATKVVDAWCSCE